MQIEVIPLFSCAWRRVVAAAALATLAVFLLARAPALAAQANAPSAADCVAPATQKLMGDCAYEDFLAATASYADSNRQYSSQLSTAQRDLFRRSQKAWLAYRTAECEFESSAVQGGSAKSMVRWQCASRMTRAWVVEMVDRGNCKEGDISCIRLKP